MKKLLTLLIFLLFVAGCGSSKPETAETDTTAVDAEDDVSVIEQVADDDTDTEEQTPNATAVVITPEMEEFKNIIDDAMGENFDEYESYYDEEGALNLDICVYGLVDEAIEAMNGNQELLNDWNEMVGILVDSNDSLVDSAKTYGVIDPIVIFNVLNDANKENILLSVRNGVVTYDAVNDGQ